MSTIKLENGQEIHIGDDSLNNNHVPIIDTQYYASPWSRLFAFIIDTILMFFVIVLISTLLPVMRKYSEVAYLGFFIMIGTILYFQIFFFLFKNTIGGIILKLNILNYKKEDPSRFKLLFRSFFIGFPLGFGLITIFFDKKKRALHDLIFGTVVTKDRIY